MANYWVTVPTEWKLQDVQAGLNVVITVLCFLSSFVFIRLCWQSAARKVARGGSVRLSTLLSVSNPGEALDAVLLLHKKMVTSRYIVILIQCIIVVALSATAIASGPIARFSARSYVLTRTEMVTGSMTTVYGGVELDRVDANLTWTRMDNASFPRDQLLDWIPDNSIDWDYNPSQWNNSWAINCTRTPETNITINTTGVCDGLFVEIPGLYPLLNSTGYTDTWVSMDTWLSGPIVKDAMLFGYSYRVVDSRQGEPTIRSLRISMTTLHMHGAGLGAKNSTKSCSFSKGLIPTSSYTKAICDVQRKNGIEGYASATSPNSATSSNIATAFTGWYGPKFTKQSLADTGITVPSPDDMIRFYQMYIAMKDTQTQKPTQRPLDIRVTVVQISAVFLGIAGTIGLLSLLGLLHYTFFMWRYASTAWDVPQSKLDWMMQSIEAENRPQVDSRGRVRQSATVENFAPLSSVSHARRKKVEFETASFGERETSTTIHRSSTTSASVSAPHSDYDPHSQYFTSANLGPAPASAIGRSSKIAANAVTGAMYPLRSLRGYQQLDGGSNPSGTYQSHGWPSYGDGSMR